MNTLQFKKHLGGIATIATCAAIVGGLLGAAPAFADTPADNTLDTVTKATPQTANDAAQVVTKETGVNAIDATISGKAVTVPVDPAAGITLGTGTGTVSISLPYASGADNVAVEKKGVVSYDNNNGSSSVPVVTANGALQINTVITNASAPSRYRYDLTIPAGGQIVPAGQGFFIVNADNDPVTFIAEPWAKDANGNAVATHYELNGSTLTQVVEHDAATAYPVVADPVFVWETGLPALKLNRAETKQAMTLQSMGTVCGWVGRYTGVAGAAVCGLNTASIMVNSQRAYYHGKCEEMLIGPGVIGSLEYSGGNCR